MIEAIITHTLAGAGFFALGFAAMWQFMGAVQ